MYISKYIFSELNKKHFGHERQAIWFQINREIVHTITFRLIDQKKQNCISQSAHMSTKEGKKRETIAGISTRYNGDRIEGTPLSNVSR